MKKPTKAELQKQLREWNLAKNNFIFVQDEMNFMQFGCYIPWCEKNNIYGTDLLDIYNFKYEKDFSMFANKGHSRCIIVRID